MALSASYHPHGIVLPGGAFIGNVTELAPEWNLQDVVESAGGLAGPFFAGSINARPMVTFSTKTVKTVLDACNIESIALDASGGNLDLYWRKGAARGTRVAAASTVHLRGRCASNALFYWDSITASAEQIAEIRGMICPTWDGSNAPIAFVNNVALAGTPAADAYHTIGPIVLNSTTLGGVTRLDIRNNVQLDQVPSDGEPYMGFVGIDNFAPTLEFETRDPTLISSIGATVAITGLTVYLRILSANAIIAANNAGTHISLSATAGVAKVRGVRGRPGVANVFCQIVKPNEATDPWTIDTTASIS